jgi:diguanylate cyclase (GGDEF)-like protein
VDPLVKPAAVPDPDAILLDIVMPGIDGIEACARIRADARYQYVPILMVTSESEVDALAQAFVAGANDYVRKPFDSVELLARLRNALKLKGEIDRRRAREQELLTATKDIRSVRKVHGVCAFDALTLLPGRGLIESAVGSLPAEGLEALGVLAVQIDNLEEFRVMHGEAAEAQLLARVAAGLSTLPSRLGDLLARYEGGTFVAILHPVSPEELSRRAEAARQIVLALGIPLRDRKGRPVTVSVGVSHGSTVKNRDPRTLFANAVAAMEQAMRDGGNRVSFTTTLTWGVS